MKYTIDRYEGEYAVVELDNQKFINIPRAAIPPEAKEGDIISVEINRRETERRKEHIKKLMDDVWAN